MKIRGSRLSESYSKNIFTYLSSMNISSLYVPPFISSASLGFSENTQEMVQRTSLKLKYPLLTKAENTGAVAKGAI